VGGESRDAAEIVVHDADIEAMPCLIGEDGQNGLPHLAFRDDEEFEENIFFGLFQSLHDPFKGQFARLKIFGGRVYPQRAPRVHAQIARLQGGVGIEGRQFLDIALAAVSGRHDAPRAFNHSPLHRPVEARLAEEDIEETAKNGKHEYGYDPRQLICRIAGIVQDPDDDRHAEDDAHRVKNVEGIRENVQDSNEDDQLRGHGEKNESRPPRE